mmetsp:Transcript_22126/g.44778  ORF Transcript_22126/g.44778 Transcript_22126/m.44778 type:complete len:133 (-) Transcript_22126:1173-1571(-)
MYLCLPLAQFLANQVSIPSQFDPPASLPFRLSSPTAPFGRMSSTFQTTPSTLSSRSGISIQTSTKSHAPPQNALSTLDLGFCSVDLRGVGPPSTLGRLQANFHLIEHRLLVNERVVARLGEDAELVSHRHLA